MEGNEGAANGDGDGDGGDRPWQSYHTVYTTAKAGVMPLFSFLLFNSLSQTLISLLFL